MRMGVACEDLGGLASGPQWLLASGGSTGSSGHGVGGPSFGTRGGQGGATASLGRPRVTEDGGGGGGHGLQRSGPSGSSRMGVPRPAAGMRLQRVCGAAGSGSGTAGSAAPSSWDSVGAGLRCSHSRLPSVRWPGQRRVRIRIRQPRGRGRCPRWGACTEGIEAWWRWLHGVGGDLLGDLTGVSDAAWRSRSSQRPAALAVLCGSRWVDSGPPDANLTSAWPLVVTLLRRLRLRLWCWKG